MGGVSEQAGRNTHIDVIIACNLEQWKLYKQVRILNPANLGGMHHNMQDFMELHFPSTFPSETVLFKMSGTNISWWRTPPLTVQRHWLHFGPAMGATCLFPDSCSYNIFGCSAKLQLGR